MIEIKKSVIYRDGLEWQDYQEAIDALRDAQRQPECISNCCSVCGDTGHSAHQCHHNPLVMARRSVFQTRVWRCFHCDEVFTNPLKAKEHFGEFETIPNAPKCVMP